MLMQPSPMAETSRLPSLRFCIFNTLLKLNVERSLTHLRPVVACGLAPPVSRLLESDLGILMKKVAGFTRRLVLSIIQFAMADYYPNSFGSMQFVSRMASLFRSQSELLDQLLEKPLTDAILHVAPLLAAIRDNCNAIILLERADLLNELALVQRIFLQRIINCCYLLNAEQDEIARFFSNPIASAKGQLRAEDDDALLDFANKFELNENASTLSANLRQQIDVIAQKTGAPKDLFLVALASIFPRSSEILAGSLAGVAFQFGLFDQKKQEPQGDTSRKGQEFCAALFFGLGLLDALFRILAKRESIEVIKKKSVENLKSAEKLMRSSPENSTQGLTPVDGTWERLESIEDRASTTISKQLRQFSQPFEDAYEAGVIVPTLKHNSPKVIDLRCAALLLKRTLNDLRGVWVLLGKGYTSQAASVAASLYESALASICLTQNKQNADKFLSNPSGEIPWSPMEMTKMVVGAEGAATSGKEFENNWRALYAHYVWLCQIKHSTLNSVAHDTSASTLDGKGYVVMAVPNVQKDDATVKAAIAVKSLMRTLECIEAFAKALGYDGELPNECDFDERVRRARKESWEAFKPFAKPSPISISRSWFVKKYPPIK